MKQKQYISVDTSNGETVEFLGGMIKILQYLDVKV